MDVPIGGKLKFINSDETVEVVNSRRVKFKEDIYYLTGITNILLGKERNAKLRRPTRYWTYNEQLLNEIYDETYGPRDS